MEYPYIAAWGIKTGAYSHYWDGVRAQAAREGAPRGAVFPVDNGLHRAGTWVTINEVPRHIRPYLHKLANLFDRSSH